MRRWNGTDETVRGHAPAVFSCPRKDSNAGLVSAENETCRESPHVRSLSACMTIYVDHKPWRTFTYPCEDRLQLTHGCIATTRKISVLR